MENYLNLPGGVGKMPIVGLGTWQAQDDEIAKAINVAINAGYRHFDTAYGYMNEEVIGRTLKAHLDSGTVKREELFIVTKLPTIGNTSQKVSHFVKKQLKALQLDYIDLYLIHLPMGLKYKNDTELMPRKSDGNLDFDYETDLESLWRALEAEVDEGRVKAIGLSNFNESQIKRIVKISKIKIANLQIEVHVYLQQKSLIELCNKEGITICAYAPVGSPGQGSAWRTKGNKFGGANPLEDPVVLDIANKYEKTAGQILIRFLVQQNMAVIPKSTNPSRILQNIQVFDFELSAEDMEQLKKLDKGEDGRCFGYSTSMPGSEKHPELPF